jgi:glycerol dehydrogenase
MSDAATIEFTPPPVLAHTVADGATPAGIFGSPRRYVQGEGVIDEAGHYLGALGFQRAAVLLSTRSQAAEGKRLLASLHRAGIPAELASFGGECSLEEIEQHTSTLGDLDPTPDVLVAIGGGKAVDAGKAIAHRLGIPSVMVPSLASNDAPCAAVSVIYTAEGVTLDAEIYAESPALVLMDTGVVANAGERYLVAGMGDAMATWYEARACQQNPAGITAFGGRPTLAGAAIAKLCADTIYEQGPEAIASLRARRVSAPLEKIVEANTLLSGLGYESGGLAAAHAYAQGFTVLQALHSNYLHGEMVAMGILGQLMLESSLEEAERVSRFFIRIGLPVHLGHLGLSPDAAVDLAAVVEATQSFPFLGNMHVPVGPDALMSALLGADQLGRQLVSAEGDSAYRALHQL